MAAKGCPARFALESDMNAGACRELEEQQVRSNAENQQLRGRVAALEGALAAAEAAAAQETRAAHGDLLYLTSCKCCDADII